MLLKIFLLSLAIQWEENADCQRAKVLASGVVVNNDHARGGVALGQEFCGLLTKDEQLQYVLQVVPGHRNGSLKPLGRH